MNNESLKNQISNVLKNADVELLYVSESGNRAYLKGATGGKITISCDEIESTVFLMAHFQKISTFTCTDFLRAIDENQVTNISFCGDAGHTMTGFINWEA